MQRHHSFLGIALFIFLVWLALVFFWRIVSFAIHVLLIVAVIAFIWWLFKVITRRSSGQSW